MSISRLDVLDVVVRLREQDLAAAQASLNRTWITYARRQLLEATGLRDVEAGKIVQGRPAI